MIELDSIRYSRLVLRGHASFLILLTAFLLVVSTIGNFAGAGPFAWLAQTPLAHVGLFQAYALMMVAGIALWIGSYDARPFKWDIVGILAHVSPLAANFMFAGPLAQIGTPSTVPLHGGLILLEASVLVVAWRAGALVSPTPEVAVGAR